MFFENWTQCSISLGNWNHSSNWSLVIKVKNRPTLVCSVRGMATLPFAAHRKQVGNEVVKLSFSPLTQPHFDDECINKLQLVKLHKKRNYASRDISVFGTDKLGPSLYGCNLLVSHAK